VVEDGPAVQFTVTANDAPIAGNTVSSVNGETDNTVSGAYGELVWNDTTGVFSYTLNSALSVIQALPEGPSALTDVFTYNLTRSGSTSPDSAIITVQIVGADDPSTISGDNSGTVDTGVLFVNDIDSGGASFRPDSFVGVYGAFQIASTGNWIYTLDNLDADTDVLVSGQTVTDSFTVSSQDGTASEVVTVTVTGSNDTAVISGTVVGAVTEDALASTVTGVLAVTDVDTGEAFFTPQTTVGVYGSLQITTDGNWTYSLDNAVLDTDALNSGQIVSEQFIVTSQDGSASEVITITVIGANDTAVISGTNQGSISEDAVTNVVSDTLTVLDVDSGEAVFVPASTVGVYGSFQINSVGNWTYTLDNANSDVNALASGQIVTDSFVVSSSDGSADETVAVTITGSNDAPILLGLVFLLRLQRVLVLLWLVMLMLLLLMWIILLRLSR